MTDRPIPFSGPMVQALLDGRKTQTRRLLKPQPDYVFRSVVDGSVHSLQRKIGVTVSGLEERETIKLPIATGDHLWVSEEHSLWADAESAHAAQIIEGSNDACIWRADYVDGASAIDLGGISWRPPIDMPRWASRLTLTVTDVRVQRLQEITEADAKAEGASWHDGGAIGHSGWRHDLSDVHADCRSSFARLWDSLNAKRAPWESNPWVAAYTFTVEQRNIDEVKA